jgi:DNA-nicking Smr family endonuclease
MPIDDDEFDPERSMELPLDGVLDLHAFAPRDVADLVPTWLDACADKGLIELRIIHGKGRGVLRRTVHAILERRDDVAHFALAPEARGGWGATLITLRPREDSGV